jgi:hypothetical protein
MATDRTIADIVRNDSSRLRKLLTDGGLSRMRIAQFVATVSPAQLWAWRNMGPKIFLRFIELMRVENDPSAAEWLSNAEALLNRHKPAMGSIENRIATLRAQLATLEAEALHKRAHERPLSHKQLAWLGALMRIARGATLQDVANQFGVTRERVRQRTTRTLSRIAPGLMAAFEIGPSKLPQFLQEHRAELEELVLSETDRIGPEKASK